MFTATVIGNLGADAEVREYNNKKFVSFKVAHTDAWTGADGVRHENTQWVSCALNGDGGSLLQYLKKGTKVCVIGSCTFGVASSKIARAMVATVNLNVRDVELCGGSSDAVPRRLVGQDGVIYDTEKFFFVDISKDENKHLANSVMYGERGGEFQVDAIGYIHPVVSKQETKLQQQEISQAKEQVDENGNEIF